MSIRLMTLAWELEIPSTPKIVLLALCDWANDDGLCYPSVSRVATRASLSTRQGKRVLHQLVDDGWIAVTANHTGGGASRRYRINVDALRTGDTSVTGVRLSPVTPATSEGVTSAARTSVAGGTRTVIEPPVEPPLPAPSELICPPLPEAERVVVVDMVTSLGPVLGQAVLDELAGAIYKGRITTSRISFVRALTGRAKRSAFTPALGLEVVERRRHQATEAAKRVDRRSQVSKCTPGVAEAALVQIQQSLRPGRMP